MRRLWRLFRHWWFAVDPADEALVVAFLAEHGPAGVLDVSMDMDDFTRGRVNWMFKSSRSIYRILNRLEATGVVHRQRDSIGNYEYVLVAARDSLVEVE